MNGSVIGLKSFVHRLSSVSLPVRLRGGAIERSLDYLKLVFNDYKQVLIDVKNDCKDRPLKASTYGSVLGFVGFCLATNPSEYDLRQQLIECQNDLSSVPKSILNRNSCDYVLEINQLFNENLLNYQSLGLFSVIYLSDYPKNSCLYVNQCQYLRPKINSYFFDRIIDFGFVHRFRVLDKKMIDYDINDNEWQTSSHSYT